MSTKEKCEIELPFRDQKPALENNRRMAEQLLELLKKKFEDAKKYKAEYISRCLSSLPVFVYLKSVISAMSVHTSHFKLMR